MKKRGTIIIGGRPVVIDYDSGTMKKVLKRKMAAVGKSPWQAQKNLSVDYTVEQNGMLPT